MTKRNNLYDPDMMKTIYETKEDKKKAAIAKRAEKINQQKVSNDIAKPKEKKSDKDSVPVSSKNASRILSTPNIGYSSIKVAGSSLDGYKIPKKNTTVVGVKRS